MPLTVGLTAATLTMDILVKVVFLCFSLLLPVLRRCMLRDRRRLVLVLPAVSLLRLMTTC